MEFLAKGKKEHNNDNLKKLSIIILEDISISGFDEILSNIEKILSKEGINHITIQPESEKYKCEIYY